MTQLVVGFEVEGKHGWPNAPKEYSDFANSHRHLFKFICWYEVSGWYDKSVDNTDPARRDKELFELRRELVSYLDEFIGADGIADFGNMSCEGLADFLKSQDKRLAKVYAGEEWFLGALV